jgi:hypothetical protein
LPFSAANPIAVCTASCDFTVNLSHLIAINRISHEPIVEVLIHSLVPL